MKRIPRNRIDTPQARDLIRRAAFDALLHAVAHGWDDDGPLTVEAAPQAAAPALLAAAMPEENRAAMQAVYERCLAHYRRVVGDGGPDDVGTAVTHFVAANMQALHGVAITPRLLLRLERQLAGVARLCSQWDTASAAERQLFFEKMAIIAVLVDQGWTAAQSQGPAALDHVRRAARGYLSELFGFEPERLTLSDDGLHIAPTAVAA